VSTDTYNLPDLRANRQRLISELEEAIAAVERTGTERFDALREEVGTVRAAVGSLEARLAEEVAAVRADAVRSAEALAGAADAALDDLRKRVALLELTAAPEPPTPVSRTARPRWWWPWRSAL
jgi:hypothetical protein